MVTSGTFWCLVCVALIACWLIPRRRDLLLAAISFAYLVTLDSRSAVALAAWAAAFYLAGPLLARQDAVGRRALSGLLLGVITYLAWFKYVAPRLALPQPAPPRIPQFFYEPGAGQYLLPLGISYFTFKLIHYAIERSRGNLAGHSPLDFFLYLVFFPIFPAGPIERFDHFLRGREAQWTSGAFVEGLGRIQRGLVKKFFVAEMVLLPLLQRPTTAELLGHLDQVSTVTAWIHVWAAFLYAYMDFAGYSDIAIGTARLFGYRISENFNYPLLAGNLGDFWKRWHMTLSGWCQAYVYLPTLGWTRNPYLATYACMMAIGLWHAGTANWIFWGAYHATGLVAFLTWSRYCRQRRWGIQGCIGYQFAARLLTLMFVAGSYAFVVTDRYGGLPAALRLLAKLGGFDL